MLNRKRSGIVTPNSKSYLGFSGSSEEIVVLNVVVEVLVGLLVVGIVVSVVVFQHEAGSKSG